MLIRVYPPPQTKTTIRSDHIRLMFALFDKSIWAQQWRAKLIIWLLSLFNCRSRIFHRPTEAGRQSSHEFSISDGKNTLLPCNNTARRDATVEVEGDNDNDFRKDVMPIQHTHGGGAGSIVIRIVVGTSQKCERKSWNFFVCWCRQQLLHVLLRKLRRMVSSSGVFHAWAVCWWIMRWEDFPWIIAVLIWLIRTYKRNWLDLVIRARGKVESGKMLPTYRIALHRLEPKKLLVKLVA